MYSDEEVKKIVDYLYALAELEVEHAENQNRKNVDRFEERRQFPMQHSPKRYGCRIPKREYAAFD